MKQFPCIESTIDLTVGLKTIRLWINRTTIPIWGPDEKQEFVGQIKEKLKEPFVSHGELLEWFTIFPDINAVQITEQDQFDSTIKYGTVVYAVPFEDVHG